MESLRSKDPSQYWKGLYDLDGSDFSDSKLPMRVKNSLNTIVTGDEACKVWINSFAKLGLEASDFYDFNTPFYMIINYQKIRG